MNKGNWNRLEVYIEEGKIRKIEQVKDRERRGERVCMWSFKIFVNLGKWESLKCIFLIDV